MNSQTDPNSAPDQNQAMLGQQKDPTVPPPPPKSKLPLFLILGLVVVVVLVGGYKLMSNSSTPPPQPTPAQSPTVSMDPTASWKTYNAGNITFKYPSEWQLASNYSYIIEDSNHNIVMGIGDSLMNECMRLDSTEARNNLLIKRYSRVTEGEMCGTNDLNEINLREIWIIRSEDTYSGISYKYSAADNPKAEEIFDQILSTFTFLDQNLSDENEEWKTYTNTKYGYSISYPMEWTLQSKCQGGIAEDDYICFLSPDFEQSTSGAVFGSTTKGGLIWIDGRGDLVGSTSDKFCQNESININDCKQITVGNLQAMQRSWLNTTQVGILNNGDIILSFRVVYSDTSKNDILQTFKQILSTFKFLNK